MAKEWIDIVDTAIKIGLGAGISGFFTYIGMKLTHDNQKEKYLIEHKVKLLEQTANDVEIYINGFYQWLNLINGLATLMEKENRDTITEEEFDIIRKQDKEFNKTINNFGSSISKVKLLKMKNTTDKLINYSGITFEIRNTIIHDKKIPTPKQIDEINTKIYTLENEVFEELGKELERIMK